MNVNRWFVKYNVTIQKIPDGCIGDISLEDSGTEAPDRYPVPVMNLGLAKK